MALDKAINMPERHNEGSRWQHLTRALIFRSEYGSKPCTPSVHTKLAEICGCSSPNFMEEIMKSWSRPIFKAHWGNHILQHISYPLGPRQGCATHPAWWHNWGARYRGASPAKATVLDLDLDNGNNISWWWIKTMLDSFFGSVLFCETPNTIQN